MSQPSQGTLVSDAEVEAAVAEALALGDQIASLEPPDLVAIPVTADPLSLKGGAAPDAGRAEARFSASQFSTETTPAGPPAVARPNLLIRVLDAVLNLIDYPFRDARPETKMLILAGGVTSGIISLAAAFALPALFPPRTTAHEVRDRVASLQSRLEAAKAAEGEAAKGGAAAKGDAHGGGAKKDAAAGAKSGGH